LGWPRNAKAKQIIGGESPGDAADPSRPIVAEFGAKDIMQARDLLLIDHFRRPLA
jgi:hypothetical protein